MDFLKRYSKLNKEQKEAVDTIDGPVMVIAGPGTGKTELLSVRAANILQKTDTLPESILCLTFTESGANEMRQRLTDIIGKDAYKISVHTFHSFGSEIINQNSQYFYEGAHYRPADELSSYEILHDIFDNLAYDNPIAKKQNNQYTYLKDSQTTISELKKSGLTSDELLLILDQNDIVINASEYLLAPIFSSRINKETCNKLISCIEDIKSINDKQIIDTFTRFSLVLSNSISIATSESIESNSTKPITAWKNEWMQKNEKGDFELKAKQRQIKLRALADVYNSYLLKMQEAELYDFDDMILRTVHAMEIFDDLRFNLQEKYQYIMVDEFQDTNLAQMRILHNLTNNSANNDNPNILVVGDDDQAIYSFQGANISNIFDFRTKYPNAKIINLTENYRSTEQILDGSRDIIIQGNNRLEDLINGIDKKLKPNCGSNYDSAILRLAETIFSERQWVVDDIKNKIDSGVKPGDIAVLTRQHKEINAILPYFYNLGIPINYERRDNVLEQPPVIFIEQISRLLISINNGQHDDVDAILSEVLSHKSFGINPEKIWKLSINAYDNHKRWLDIMSSTPEFELIYKWLIETASQINDTPLETMLDIIIGKNNNDLVVDNEKFISPFYNFFFSNEKLKNNPNEYLIYLEALRTIRSKLREYRPDQTPTLISFINFISLNRKIGSTISAIRSTIQTDNAINLMTVHKSKGLEFNTVYIINVVDSVWGEKSRGHSRSIGYPENLRLAPAGENEDERLRLFFVAITRAKKQLNISYSKNDDNNKPLLPANFLSETKWKATEIISKTDLEQLIESTELAWYQPIIEPITKNMHDILQPILDKYKLSVTHLNSFLDITRGGPSTFLMQNLLRFPTAKSANAEYGTAIHNTLQQAHLYYISTGKKQKIDDILKYYESNLAKTHLNSRDFKYFLQKGIEVLQKFISKKHSTFSVNQLVELNFSNQQCVINDTHLTGKIDLADVDKISNTITVTDYKTGDPIQRWTDSDAYKKIKLHKFKQQLMFYKLLIENSRDYHKYIVNNGIMQFVEADKSDEIISLEASFSNEEIEEFSKLIKAVWEHIINLNLPDTSNYEQTIKGILAFEKDLVDGKI